MKQAYISGALSGAEDLNAARNLYAQFAKACAQVGWNGYLPHQNTDPEHTSHLSASSVTSKDLIEIIRADAVIIYLGQPSLGVGAEVAIAMHLCKPILGLYEKSRQFSRFVKGMLDAYPSAQVFAYQTIDEASAWLTVNLQSLPPVANDKDNLQAVIDRITCLEALKV